MLANFYFYPSSKVRDAVRQRDRPEDRRGGENRRHLRRRRLEERGRRVGRHPARRPDGRNDPDVAQQLAADALVPGRGDYAPPRCAHGQQGRRPQAGRQRHARARVCGQARVGRVQGLVQGREPARRAADRAAPCSWVGREEHQARRAPAD